jgi:hypothetical protein
MKESGNTTALDHYIAREEAKTFARLPGPAAQESVEMFRRGVSSATTAFASFLEGGTAAESWLMLGKVQSGKTAHLMASLAWAAGQSVACAVLFTGTTRSLDDQTFRRVQSDLSTLPGTPFSAMRVPTRSARSWTDFQEAFLSAARERISKGARAPLPLLVSMKTNARLEAVGELLKAMSDATDEHGVFVGIDDESDQASQNARARQRDAAPTYEKMAGLRSLPLRNLWLSYTATPQAVLLTDRAGALRPDFVELVAPRPGYFGLEAALGEDFQGQRVVIDDFRVAGRQLQVIPESLQKAILSYVVGAWTRINRPRSFYGRASNHADLAQRLRSTQMLIHESALRDDHSRVYRLVRDEVDRLKLLVRESISVGPTGLAHAELGEQLRTWHDQPPGKRSDEPSIATEILSADGLVALLEFLEQMRVEVVNSRGTRDSLGEPRPVEDSDFERAPGWILIGGDILGRGLTIPQLTVTYFVRSARTPNLDTVLQQLRFCGYRRDYESWLAIYAPRQTFSDLAYMSVVDRVAWDRAEGWAESQRKLTGSSMPSVFYVSPRGARFEPTRASVRDPDLIDRQLRSSGVLSLYDIFQPADTAHNVRLVERWTDEAFGEPTETSKSHSRYDFPSPLRLQRLLDSWNGSTDEEGAIRSLSELFSENLGDLGLADVPASVVVGSDIRALRPNSRMSAEEIRDSIHFTRRLTSTAGGATIIDWHVAFENEIAAPRHALPRLAVGHIGDGQRALRRWMPHDGTLVIIEPLLGIAPGGQRAHATAIGLGLAVLGPDNFHIRTMGHA